QYPPNQTFHIWLFSLGVFDAMKWNPLPTVPSHTLASCLNFQLALLIASNAVLPSQGKSHILRKPTIINK
ncbi:MAG: hypothetical protein ABIP75_15410, partial [Pyrinomonadaceae bacterium]